MYLRSYKSSSFIIVTTVFFAVTILIVKQKDAHGRREKRVILFENSFVRKKEFIFENHNKDDKGEKQVLLTSG